MAQLKILAIIPARGGSKGIPHKNIRLVGNKPLLAYSIEHAQQTEAITRIVVSTEDSEIAGVAQHYGAEVVPRPLDISGDEASSESALLHVLNYLREQEDYAPDLVVFLQATSPIRPPHALAEALHVFHQEDADSLLSVSPFHGFLWRSQAGSLTSLNYDYHQRQRRQDAPEDVIENGSFYIFKPHILLQEHNRLGGKIAMFRLDHLSSFQVDEPEDLELIEYLLPFAKKLYKVNS